jgi:hypothetical protein
MITILLSVLVRLAQEVVRADGSQRPHPCLIVSMPSVTCFTAGLMLSCRSPDRSLAPKV